VSKLQLTDSLLFRLAGISIKVNRKQVEGHQLAWQSGIITDWASPLNIQFAVVITLPACEIGNKGKR